MRLIVRGVRLDEPEPGPGNHLAATPHHMREWAQWHGGRPSRTVRQCPHGAFHPDPDDAGGARRDHEAHAAECDGCCDASLVRPGPVRVGTLDLGLLLPGVADHSSRHCDGQGACPLHDPTRHALRSWPQFHGTTINFTVRECPHGVLHPDPDDRRWGSGRHECDGCCARAGGRAG